MKKLHWILLALFSVAAAALRRWQLLTGFDAAGLPVKGNPGGLGLLFLLLAAMAVFILPCLKLRGGRSDEDREMAAYFPAGKNAQRGLWHRRGLPACRLRRAEPAQLSLVAR